MDSDPDAPQSPDLLRSSLLDGVIYLFAAIAAADEDLEAGETDYVRAYLGSHIDGPRCDILMALFLERAHSEDPSSAAVTFIAENATAADRAFLLLKGAELVHQSRTPAQGREAFSKIARSIGFEEADFAWALQFASEAAGCSDSQRFQALLIRPADDQAETNSQSSALILPGCAASVDIVFTEGTTLIRCRAGSTDIAIGSRVPAADSLVRLDESEPLHLGPLRLSARDLRFYAARQGLPAAVATARCFITPNEGDFSLSAAAPPRSCLQLDLDRTRLSITPLKLRADDAGSDSGPHRRGPSQDVTVATTFRYGGKVLALRPILQALWPGDWSTEGENTSASPEHRAPALSPTALPVASLRLDEAGIVYPGGHIGLDQISFESQFGHLVCLLGPSGCGKSTLLNVLNGSLPPSSGRVTLNGKPISQAAGSISYVPQDDLLDPNLTVGENLRFGAELRMPGAGSDEIDLAVTRVLHEIGLSEWRNTRVGDPTARTLSGGQRKRVNIGLELLGDRRVLLLDEPTSGLSAADAWQVSELLRRRADHGDLVVVVAHQPSARLLDLFTQVVVLDRGGRLAFFGATDDAYRYFAPYAPKLSFASRDANHTSGEPAVSRDPELIFTALERRSRHIDGSRSDQRRFPPTFWQAHYRANRSQWRPPLLRVERGGESMASTSHPSGGTARRAKKGTAKAGPSAPKIAKPASARPSPKRSSSRHALASFSTLIRREFLSRRRAVSHLTVALLSALVLGGAIAWACRLDPSGHDYQFAANPALQHFMFLSIVTVLFLAMSASVSEIVRDRPLRQRERLLQVPTSFYLAAKFLPLLCLVVVQTGLFLALGYAVLEITEQFVSWWLLLSVTACCGLSIGLLVSSLPGISGKAAAAAIPLLLIPQIILAGADPFPFKNMAHLRLGTVASIPDDGPESTLPAMPEGYAAPPEIAQIVPSRWAYEGLLCLYRDRALGGRIRMAKQEMRDRINALFTDAKGDSTLEWKSNDLPRRLVIALRALTTPSISTDAKAGLEAVSQNEKFLELSGGRPCSEGLVELFVLYKSFESGPDGWGSLPEWMQNYDYSPELAEWWQEPVARPLADGLPRDFQSSSERNYPAKVTQPMTGRAVSPTRRSIDVLLLFTAILLITTWLCLRFESQLDSVLRQAKRVYGRLFSRS